MKKLAFIFVAVLLVFFAPVSVAYAKGIDAPVAAEEDIHEVFFCYDEYLELFSYSQYHVYNLKPEFKPYYDTLLKERFLGRLRLVEDETFECTYQGQTYELPVYVLGTICMSKTINPSSEIWLESIQHFSDYKADIHTQFANALVSLNDSYDTSYWERSAEGTTYYFYVMAHPHNRQFDIKKDIGIAIKYEACYFPEENENYENYEYPNHDEYYEMLSGKSYKPSPTPAPKPTATPTPEPTSTPTPKPTNTPTPEPTSTPTPKPTNTPTPEPTSTPTPEPTDVPKEEVTLDVPQRLIGMMEQTIKPDLLRIRNCFQKLMASVIPR